MIVFVILELDTPSTHLLSWYGKERPLKILLIQLQKKFSFCAPQKKENDTRVSKWWHNWHFGWSILFY